MKIKAALFVSAFFLLSPLAAEKISFSAESMSGTAGSSTSTTSLKGSAYILTDSMEIHADEITLSGKDYRIITAEGNISGRNLQSELSFTCSSMKYDRQTKIAVLENSVHLIDEKNSVTADAEIIEYNQDTDIAVMSVQVSLVQKDNHCTASYAVYKKTEQMLELTGNPRITQGEDTFRAQNITLNLETNEITLDGRVKGSVVSKSKEEENKTESPAPAKEATESSETKTEPSEEKVTAKEETQTAEKNTEVKSKEGEEQ
ncbi:MAG: organic solvent tolerance protein OstA [Treponema sp.]|nr:organic solvent tolerance protein OstA [Treponema sp.]